ncbi:MAG: hypothetical protein LBT02_03735 [Rickettsiales bacterium]|jgi:cell division protein FtsB|nr:hypothetical protein [Rickettsiales bacterium]
MSNDKKNDLPKKKNEAKVYILLLVVMVASAVYLLYSPFFLKPSPKNDIIVNDIRQQNQDLEDLKTYIKQENQTLKEEMEDLKEQLSSRIIDTQKDQIIRIALNIQNDLRLFKSYKSNLESLKILPLPDDIKNEIYILDAGLEYNLTNEKINDDFQSELKEFLQENNLLKTEKSIFINFIAKFVIVKNNKQTESNVFLKNLQNAMNRGDYKRAQFFLQNTNNFDKTKINVELFNNLNKSIDNIIIYLTNGGQND